MKKLFATSFHRAGLWFGVSILCVAGIANVSPAGADDEKAIGEFSKRDATSVMLQREGTKIVKTNGYFRISSGRVLFTSKDNSKANFVCLENLLLQRVSEDISKQTEVSEWIVTGELTEFRNANYFFVKTAQKAN